MPSFVVHFEVSLWWLIGYLGLGLLLGIAFVLWSMKSQRRSLRSFGAARTFRMVGLWMVGWPVTLVLVSIDESGARRWRKARQARQGDERGD